MSGIEQFTPESIRVFRTVAIIIFVVITSGGFAVFHYYWQRRKNKKGNFYKDE